MLCADFLTISLKLSAISGKPANLDRMVSCVCVYVYHLLIVLTYGDADVCDNISGQFMWEWYFNCDKFCVIT